MADSRLSPDLNALALLSDDALHERTLQSARREQALTLVTLEHLGEVNRRRVHLARGYASIFEYTVKSLGFSEQTAAERIQAMRLLEAVPEVAPLIEAGELTLTTAASVQRFVRREEKEAKRPFTLEEKKSLVFEVAGQSTRQAQRTLLGQAANPEAHLRREKERLVTPELTELTLLADAALMSEITRVRELRGAEQTLAEIFRSALGVYLRQIDPLRKPQQAASRAREKPARAPESVEGAQATQAPESEPGASATPVTSPSRYIPVAERSEVTARSQGRCEYRDTKTGRRCSSRTQLQYDHRQPFALGGPTEAANLRHYCPAHNRLAAIQAFGRAKMRPFLRY